MGESNPRGRGRRDRLSPALTIALGRGYWDHSEPEQSLGSFLSIASKDHEVSGWPHCSSGACGTTWGPRRGEERSLRCQG